ncbi:MAG: carboxypeptidase-like regulatory domain-containing protein, partial [Bacteroidota bacterium]
MNRPSSVNNTSFFRFYILGCLLFTSFVCKAQEAIITGFVLDENETPLSGVNITSNTKGTVSDESGYYLLRITAELKNTITFTHIGHKNVVLEDLVLTTNETFEFNPVLKTDAIQIAGVDVSASGEKKVDGILTIQPDIVRNIPGANTGVENILKLLPGVSF